MFLGHFAVAFAARRAAPSLSLGALVAAAQWADLLWPVLLLAGVERVTIAPGDTAVTPLRFDAYPWSHGLLALLAWGALGAALAWRRGRRAALVVAALVVSHWVLDAVVHRPDLPLAPGAAAKVGLGLWNSVPVTLALELAIFAAGVALWWRDARPRRGAIALVAFLALVYAGNVFGPPPPSARAVAWVTLAMWLLVPWAAWADRPRRAPTA